MIRKMSGMRFLVIALVIFVGGLMITGEVFADDGGGWVGVGSGTAAPISGGGGGSGCSTDSAWRYREDCTGASWIFYKTVNTNNTETITFAPTRRLYLGGKLGSEVEIPAECSQHENGGVWIYGINGQANKDGRGFEFLGLSASLWNTGYWTQNGNWGHWATTGFGLISWLGDQAKSNIYHELKDNSGTTVYQASKEVYLDGTNKVDIGGAVVSNNPTLLEAYANALKYSGSSWSAKNGIQKGTYAFCYWPGMGDAQYSTLSNVSNSKLGNHSTTGINGGELKTINTTTVYASVNEKVTINFSHNAYSSAAADKVSWRLTRSGLESGENYGVEQKYGEGLTSVASGSGYKFDVPENNRYTTSDRKGESAGVKYLVREQFEVTFLKENKSGYTFCEMLGVGPDGETKDYTQACTKIIVSGCVGEECPNEDCVGENCDPGDDGGGPLSNVCGDGKLGSYSTGTTAVLSRVVNPRLVADFSDWRNLTYAKPNDPIYWTNCYFPGVQEHYNKNLVERNNAIIGTHGAHNTCGCSSNSYAEFQSGITWTNEVTLNTDSPRGFNEWTLTGMGPMQIVPSLSNGDYQTKTYRNSYRIAQKNDAGQTYKDDVYTPGTPVSTTYGTEAHSWTKSCPSCCGCGTHRECGGDPVTCWDVCNSGTATYTHCNEYTVGTYSNGSRKEESEVKVPYNFINTAGVEVSVYSSNVMDAVYAGEKINVNNPWVEVGTKDNRVTEYKYSTQVDDAQVRLVAYASSSPYGGVRTVKSSKNSEICALINDDMPGHCDTVTVNNDTILNNDGYSETEIRYTNTIPNNETVFNGTYNVYDVAAGNYMCFVMAVWPYTSGSDDNLKKEGDETWYISAPACKKIAKKPSVQILGGGVFSAGGIKTNTSDKSVIEGIVAYTANSDDSRRVFGSFAEQAVISNNLVEGFASGAATGRLYVGDSLGGSPEGSVVSFCDHRVPLSFANMVPVSSTNFTASMISGICPGAAKTGELGVSISTVNRQALAEYFVNGQKTNVRDGDYVKLASATGKNIYLAEVTSNNYGINGRTLSANETRIVKADGNVRINGDITYNDSQRYTMLNVPKMVIYASGNINIDCNVRRVDAILIAGGTVATCDGYSATNDSTWDAQARRHQLTINGAVVANKIDFGRAYGNTPGAGSDDPAEIINYDTSAIVWGRSMADAGESDTLTVVYQRELAPRY